MKLSKVERRRERCQEKLHDAQMVRLYPHDETIDESFTPTPREREEVSVILQDRIQYPGESRGWNIYQGQDLTAPYEGIILVDPFDPDARTAPSGDPDEVHRPRDVYYVHHGWITRCGGDKVTWWRDRDRELEELLLALCQRYGLDAELSRRGNPMQNLPECPTAT